MQDFHSLIGWETAPNYILQRYQLTFLSSLFTNEAREKPTYKGIQKYYVIFNDFTNSQSSTIFLQDKKIALVFTSFI